MDTVLVIGAAGLVGSHLMRAFDGERVVATYHRTPVGGGVELDVSDPAAVHALVEKVRPRTIALAAAEPWVDRCEREPEATRRLNVEAAADVASAARRVGARLVVFSSEYVFDGSKGPYGEDDPVAPINEYGRQKVALEQIARTIPEHLVCRTSGVYGNEPAGKNFVCQLVLRLQAGQRFAVPNDQVITPTYAPDLASAVADLVRRGASGVFHVVGPEIVARAAFARATARTFNLPVELIEERSSAEMGYAARRPTGAGLRDDKLRATLGRRLRGPAAALADLRGVLATGIEAVRLRPSPSRTERRARPSPHAPRPDAPGHTADPGS